MIKNKKSSEQKIADKIGCSRQWISKITARGDFMVSDLANIADALGYDAFIQFIDRTDKSVITAIINTEQNKSETK
jgi:transcriptional regulator with XRE-family HTH domain